ncbi:MAG: translation initiation factor IF-2 [Clostridia bacterium]|nr:translation initiation factor IF-2 [Clostridia bacterium]
MFRINQLSKDLDIRSKDLITKLEGVGLDGKKTMTVLEADEANLLLDMLTKENQLSDLDGYVKGKTAIPSVKPSKAALEKREKKAAQAKAKAEAEAVAKAEAEAKAKAEAEAVAKAEAEAKAAAKDAALMKAAAAAKARADAEKAAKEEAARKKQEAEARAKAEAEAVAKKAAEPKSEQKPERQDKPQQQARPQQNTQNNQQRRDNNNNNNHNNRPQRPADAQHNAQIKPQQTMSDKVQKAYENQKKQSERVEKSYTPDQSTMGGKKKAPQAPQNERKRTGATRVIDTRASSVDLSKYDEKLDNFVHDSHRNENASNKQKLKKQNNRDMRSSKNRNKESAAMEKLKKQEAMKAKQKPLEITVPEEISVGELASRLKVTAAEVVKRLMMMGMMVTVNQIIDFDTAYLIADELGAVCTREVVVTIEEKLFNEEEDNDENLVERPPVVCVMGHVDHGKTSLLDAIRHTSVTKGEAGGITQHIGAYTVNIDGKDITFLDTPGHEAFTAMRARGAQATDIAILVVAADDGIMPQTIEAINHAKAAGVEIIVAINKMDKPTANPDAVKSELTNYSLVPEEWGGDVMCVPVSALTGMGISDLLESVLLIAEVKEYKANPARRAKGIVIEAKLDRGRGPVATVLVQAGTLHSGDIVIAGTAVGRVRAMTDDKGKNLKTAGPSVPVEIIGLAEVPLAGDEFNAVEDERMARTLAEQRREKAKEEEFKANAKVNLDDLFSQIKEGVQELNVIVKADVGGSAEAVKQSLEKISNDEVKVRVIHSAAGGITEGDVMFAAASNAIIVGFNVRPDKSAIDSAERQSVDIRTYRVIYECIEEITAAMKGMLAPEFVEKVLGHAEVRQTIRVPNVGTIAGSYVQDGMISRHAQIRVVRDGVVIFEDKISSLKRFKDDAKEVQQGYECGIGLEKFNDIKEGDILEAFIMEEVAR